MSTNNTQAISWMQIAHEPVQVFIADLQQYSMPITSFDLSNPDDMQKLGVALRDITNNFTALTALSSVVSFEKRRLKREGKKQEYEDMVDREQALELVLKDVDMQQKTVSKILSFHMDQNRELYYLEGRTRRKS